MRTLQNFILLEIQDNLLILYLYFYSSSVAVGQSYI